jgi:hypothetical protein
MALKQTKEYTNWLKNEIYHQEVLLRCSLSAVKDRSEFLSNLFLAQAKRIEKRLAELKAKLSPVTKKKKSKKKK